MVEPVELEQIVPGQLSVRGEQGKFAEGGTLSSERASEIGKKGAEARASKRETEGGKKAEALGAALKEYLCDPADPRAPALSLLLDQLSEGAAGGATARVKAVETALRLIGVRSEELRPPSRSDEPCRLCGRKAESIVITVSDAVAESLYRRHGVTIHDGEIWETTPG